MINYVTRVSEVPGPQNCVANNTNNVKLNETTEQESGQHLRMTGYNNCCNGIGAQRNNLEAQESVAAFVGE
jgi:hypothetical protein